MNTPLSVMLMNRLIEKLVKIDTGNHMKLSVASPLSAFLYEVNGTSKEDGIYIYCDALYCTVEYRDFDRKVQDVCTLTEGNLDDTCHWTYTCLMGG